MALKEVYARFTTRFDGTALRAGEGRVRALSGSLNTALEKLGSLGSAFAALAVVSIIRSWVSAAAEFVDSMREIGDELDKTSRVVGISTGAIQSWRHAADLSGVGAEQFTQGLIRIQANMRQALITPTSSAALAFRRLGVNLRGADGNLRGVEDVLIDMADPLANLASDSERVAILTALAGRSGARMGPLFEQGRAGVEAMRAELERLGGGATPEMIQAAADLTDAQARLDLALLSVKSRIAVALLPIIQTATEAITALTAWFARNQAAALALKIAVFAITGAITIMALVVGIVLSPILILLAFLFGVLALAVAAVVLVVEDLYQWFTGGQSVIGNFVEALLGLAGISLEGIRQEVRDLISTITEGYNGIASTLGLPTIETGPATVDTRSAGPKREGGPAEAGPRTTSGQRFLQGLRNTAAGGAAEGGGLGRLAGGVSRTLPVIGDVQRIAAAGSRSVQQNNTINVQGTSEQIVDRIRRELDRSNRDASEALTQ